MGVAQLEAPLDRVFDAELGDAVWLEHVLSSVCRRIRARQALAYSWGPHLTHPTLFACEGNSAAGRSLVARLFSLPRAWFQVLHPSASHDEVLQHRLTRLPPRIRAQVLGAIERWSPTMPPERIRTVLPIATPRLGLGLWIATPPESARSPRGKQGFSVLMEQVAMAFALRQATPHPEPDALRNASGGGTVWKELLEGKWAILRTERTNSRNTLLLVRAKARSARHPRCLTSRERQVVALTLEGRSNKWIGWRLGLATATVAFHLAAANAKLGLRSRAELLTFFGRGRQS